jgi:hypothetical protein
MRRVGEKRDRRVRIRQSQGQMRVRDRYRIANVPGGDGIVAWAFCGIPPVIVTMHAAQKHWRGRLWSRAARVSQDLIASGKIEELIRSHDLHQRPTTGRDLHGRRGLKVHHRARCQTARRCRVEVV